MEQEERPEVGAAATEVTPSAAPGPEESGRPVANEPPQPDPQGMSSAPTRAGFTQSALALVLISALMGGVVGGAAVTLVNSRGREVAVAETTARPGASASVGDYERNTIEVVRAVTPGVVQVHTTGAPVSEAQVQPSSPFGFSFPGLPDLFSTPRSQERVVPRAYGSGFVYDRQGRIVTNNHVIEGAQKIQVVFPDNKTYDAVVVGADRLVDLAVLKINAPLEELHPLTLADSDQVQVGQKAIAIGSPLGPEGGLGLDRSPSVTMGIVSAKDRSLPIPSKKDPGVRDFTIDKLIQTDAAINPGNSGGPLVDSRGQVIGITTAIVPQAHGIGFAVPSNVVRRVFPILAEGKTVGRASLGLTFVGLDGVKNRLGADYHRLNLPDSGALVISVTKGSPAEKAGLRGGGTRLSLNGEDLVVGGDIITAVDGAAIAGDNLADEILQHKPGDVVKLTVLRDGQSRVVEVTLGTRPAG